VNINVFLSISRKITSKRICKSVRGELRFYLSPVREVGPLGRGGVLYSSSPRRRGPIVQQKTLFHRHVYYSNILFCTLYGFPPQQGMTLVNNITVATPPLTRRYTATSPTRGEVSFAALSHPKENHNDTEAYRVGISSSHRDDEHQTYFCDFTLIEYHRFS
jgi:hypothetical protein